MPLMNYTPQWTPQQFESELALIRTQAGGDISKIPGLLNNRGWTVNDMTLRDYVEANHPDIYAVWKSKYGSFFHMDPRLLGALAVAAGFGLYLLFRKNKPIEKEPF